MNVRKNLLENLSWNSGQVLWLIILNLVATPTLIHYLGAEVYGTYLLLLSLIGVLGIAGLGLGDATLHYVAHYNNKRDEAGINRVFGATLAVYSLLGILIVGVLSGFPTQLVRLFDLSDSLQAESILVVVGILFFLNLLAGVFEAVPRAIERYDSYAVIKVTIGTLQPIALMIAAVRGADILGLILVTAGVGALRLGGSVLIAKRFLPSLRILQVPDPAGIREVFGYGVYTFLTQVMSSLWRNLDRILLGIFAGPAAIAYVIVPADLLLKVTGAIGSASSVLFPRFTSLKESLQKTRDIFWVSTWVTLSLTILIFVPATIIMESFLSLWINPEFAANSARVAQLIAFSNIIRGAFIPYDSLYKGQGRPQYLAGLYLITGTISVIVDTLLISQFGLAGAGYSYIATVGVGVGMIILTKQNILREESWRPFCQSVLLPSVIAFLFLAFFDAQNMVSIQGGWWQLIQLTAIIVLSLAGTLLALDMLAFRKSSYVIMGIHTLRIKTQVLG